MADAKSNPLGTPSEGAPSPSPTRPATSLPPVLLPLLDLLEDTFLASTARDPLGAAYGTLALARLRAVLTVGNPGPAELDCARNLARWLGASLTRGGGASAEAAELERWFQDAVEDWLRTRTLLVERNGYPPGFPGRDD